jgi:hypothetical protein
MTNVPVTDAIRLVVVIVAASNLRSNEHQNKHINDIM